MYVAKHSGNGLFTIQWSFCTVSKNLSDLQNEVQQEKIVKSVGEQNIKTYHGNTAKNNPRNSNMRKKLTGW